MLLPVFVHAFDRRITNPHPVLSGFFTRVLAARGLQVVTPSPSEMMHDMGTHSPAHTSHGTPSPAMDISESVAPTSTETDGAVVASGVASYTTVLASCAMALVAGAMWAL